MTNVDGLWMSPLDPYGIIGRGVPTGADFWDLVNAGKTSEWQSVLSNVSVFILNAYPAAVEPEANLRSLFSFLEMNHIKLALGTGVLHNEGVPGPGYLVEGYNGALDPIVNRIKIYGGNLQILVMDEPFYFGTQWAGPYAAQAPIVEIAQMTADGIAKVKKHFPNVQVADTEPMVPTQCLPEWLQAYKDAVGAPLDYFIADNDWYGHYEDNIRDIRPLLAADGTKFGVIYNGGADNNDIVWTQRAAANYRSIEADPTLRPDFAAFSTWTPNPTRYLSEDMNGTLTNLMLDYLKFKGVVASDPVIIVDSDGTSNVSTDINLQGSGKPGQTLFLYDECSASGTDNLGPSLGAFGGNAPSSWQGADSSATFLSGSDAEVVRLSGYNSAISRGITRLTIGQAYRVTVSARASAVASSSATHSALIIAIQDAANGRLVIGDVDVDFGQDFKTQRSVVFIATSENMSLQFLNFREEPSLLDLHMPELVTISMIGMTQVDNVGKWATHINLTGETKHTLIVAAESDPIRLDDFESEITAIDLTPVFSPIVVPVSGGASADQSNSVSPPSNDPAVPAAAQNPVSTLDKSATAPNPPVAQTLPVPEIASSNNVSTGMPSSNVSPSTTPIAANVSTAPATPVADVGPPTSIAAPLSLPVAALPNFLVVNTTNTLASSSRGDSYSGPFAGLQHQYINITPDSLAIAAASPNSFIVTGSGNDAIDVSSVGGNNVLDGGTGSNFLVGGAGNDTFFIDNRNETAVTWSTVANFHSGDAATLWGLTPQNVAMQWLDEQGAIGHQGLTLAITGPGRPNVNLTLSGYTTTDLSNGRLSTVFGIRSDMPDIPQNPYLYIHAN